MRRVIDAQRICCPTHDMQALRLLVIFISPEAARHASTINDDHFYLPLDFACMNFQSHSSYLMKILGDPDEMSDRIWHTAARCFLVRDLFFQ